MTRLGRRRNARRRESTAAPRAVRVRAAAAPPVAPATAAQRRVRRLVALGIAGAVALVPLSLAGRKLAAHPALAVRTVTVHGVERVPEEEIRELAAVEPGAPWFGLDRRGIRSRLEAHPWVARARVLRPWPGRVRVSITECEPVARVEIAGRIYGLCEDLRVVPAGEAELPLLRVRGGEGTDPAALRRGLDWAAALRKAELAGTEPVRIDVGDGDRIVLPERGFAAMVDESIPVSDAARDVLAFLETLDGEGGVRGTLRLVSGGTGVWRAAGGRPIGAG